MYYYCHYSGDGKTFGHMFNTYLIYKISLYGYCKSMPIFVSLVTYRILCDQSLGAQGP
jgi:hypothetical protein